MRPCAALALCLFVFGCATPQTRHLMEFPPAALPAKTLIEDVPFFHQAAYYCGPAALAMTMNYHALDITQKALALAVYVPELKGSLQAEMLAATRRQGLLAYVLTPDLQSLLAEIATHHPVVVLQNLGVSWYPVWHYAVAIGYDLDAGELILHSGDNAYYRVALRVFERTWARGDYWALAPLPPDVMPRDNNPLRFLQATAALEETGHTRAARAAYTAAVRRWPHNIVAHMGVGNTHYASGDTQGAAQAFATAAALDLDAAAAFNNLAVSLSELGCDRNALATAKRAVAVDTDQNASFRETLKEVKAASTAGPEPHNCARFVVNDIRQTHLQ